VADPKDKAYSAPLPLRAIGDPNLAGLDLRVLSCIAAHDHMSLKLGKGQGCHASHETLAAKIGCNYINLGKSIRKLEDLGYLDCSRQPGRGKFHTYRIPASLYDHQESLSFHQPSADARAQAVPEKVGQTTNDSPEKVCHGVEENQAETDTSSEQYISLSDERYSVETGERYSSEEARFAARGLSRLEFNDNVGGQLAKLERDLKAGQKVDCLGWTDRLFSLIEDEPDNELRNWAARLNELVIEAMDDEEYRTWSGDHGWADDKGEWHAPVRGQDEPVTVEQLAELRQTLDRAGSKLRVGAARR
jgi:hypothetical protein